MDFLKAIVIASMIMALPGQNPPDVTFLIAPKDARTRFRMGEQIDFEFRLTSTTPKKYLVNQGYRSNSRRVRLGAPFVVEPTAGTADPLLDLPALFEGVGGGVMSSEPQYLSDTPRLSEAILNESISFRAPGRYRVSATTTQAGILLKSNTVELEIVEPEPGWAETKLREAVAILKGPSTCQAPPIGRGGILRSCGLQAARTLRFLDTPGAAVALVELFSRLRNMGYENEELRLGLFSSPHRRQILAAMDAELESPDVPIDTHWMDTMVELAAATITGPRPLPRADDRTYFQSENDRYQAQFLPVARRYYEKLASAAERKQGEARRISLGTLANRR
jgi:hypothetical protein